MNLFQLHDGFPFLRIPDGQMKALQGCSDTLGALSGNIIEQFGGCCHMSVEGDIAPEWLLLHVQAQMYDINGVFMA